MVEFGLAAPGQLKVEDRNGKVFLRRWAEQFLPKDHLWSKKKGFTVPVGAWLRGERMTQLAVACQGHAAFQGIDETTFVWALLQYGLWYERFVQGRAGVLHVWVEVSRSS